MNNEETLREALIDLEHAKEQEHRLRLESDGLLKGLNILIRPVDSRQMFRELMEVMREVLGFEQAFVLVSENDRTLTPVASTDARFEGSRWIPQAMFQRVMAGNPIASFDVRQTGEWRVQPDKLLENVTSALHIPMLTNRQAAVLVCTHSSRAFFNHNHLNLAKRFTPLASQAMINAEAREIEVRQKLLEEEKQSIEERNALLEEARDKAITASRLKSEFLSTMSHEIRTPMHAIIGMTDLMADTQLEESQRELLNMTRSSAQDLLRIINDILDFSKIEAGKLEIESIDFYLRECIESSILTLFNQAKNKGLELSTRITEEIPTYCQGDPTRLRQILTNLVSNAIKFTEAGSVIVDVSLIYKTPEECRIRIQVKDTGIGIEPDKLSYLFEPFTQADTSHTRKFGGTGLGLPITLQLSRLLGGSLSAKSEPGKGTTFSVELPFKPIGSLETAHEDNRADALENQTTAGTAAPILVAEDNKANKFLIERMLKRLGQDYRVVSNGQEAIEALQSGTYSMILMDCQMPELDGLEATRRIRRLEESRHSGIPIVALTANAIKGDREQCLAAGMDDYLSKPLLMEDLQTVLNRWANIKVEPAPGRNEPKGDEKPAANSQAYDPFIFDPSQLLEMLDGDREGAQEVVEVFIDSASNIIEKISAAATDSDSDALEKLAHTLKGSASSIGAYRIKELAYQLQISANDSGDHIRPAQQLRHEMERFRKYLGDHPLC